MGIAQNINGRLRKVPAWPIYVLLPIPGIWSFWLAASNQLGPDPLYALQADLGEKALQLIILTLLVTPLRRLTGVSLIKFRRAVGVVSFVYVLAHLLTWLVLDQRLNIAYILEEIVKRPFITVGMIGFVAMLPLAITSNNLSIRRLGPAVWTKIHRLAYLVAIAGAVHYLLVVKAWPIEPMIYAAVVAMLLLVRALWYLEKRRVRARRA